MEKNWIEEAATFPVSIVQMVGKGEINNYAVDSRLVKKGCLFFALSGVRTDGHYFLHEVARLGAKAAVVRKDYTGPDFGMVLWKVDSPLDTLQYLAKKKREKIQGQVVGITGSSGKTTTKDFLKKILEASFTVIGTEGNANSQIGLPLFILNTQSPHVFSPSTVWVIEMGISTPGEMDKLVDIVQPDIALITNVGCAHIGAFIQEGSLEKGIENLHREKGRICAHPRTKRVVSKIEVKEKMYPSYSSLEWSSFSLEKEADFMLIPGYWIKNKEGESPRFDLLFTESSFLENLLGAIAVCRVLGMSWEKIILQLEKLEAPELRFQKIMHNKICFINDCYNANPDSMRRAFQNIPSPQMGGKKIAVIGEMTDLGIFSDAYHRQIAELEILDWDHVLLFGKKTKVMLEVYEKRKIPVELFTNLDLLKERMYEIAKQGDVVLIKGSKHNGLWYLLEDILSVSSVS